MNIPFSRKLPFRKARSEISMEAQEGRVSLSTVSVLPVKASSPSGSVPPVIMHPPVLEAHPPSVHMPPGSVPPIVISPSGVYALAPGPLLAALSSPPEPFDD